MSGSCLSLVSLYGKFLRRTLTSAGLSSQTTDVDSATTIHFWGPNPPADCRKQSLVLLHGFGPAGVWQWRQQIAAFATHYNLYIPDLVFFGGSTTTSSERSEVFQASAIGKLMEKIGVERYSVVGTSYGGFVAYRMAGMWPERVEKVVIASSGVNMRRNDNLELIKRANVEKIEELMLPATAAQLRTLMRLTILKRLYFPDFFLNDFIQKLYTENREEKLELLRGLTLGQDDTVKLATLEQVALIIWGEHDQIFLLEKATELKEMMGEKVTLEIIKKTSHVPQIEHAKHFNNLVLNFLST